VTELIAAAERFIVALPIGRQRRVTSMVGRLNADYGIRPEALPPSS